MRNAKKNITVMPVSLYQKEKSRAAITMAEQKEVATK